MQERYHYMVMKDHYLVLNHTVTEGTYVHIMMTKFCILGVGKGNHSDVLFLMTGKNI